MVNTTERIQRYRRVIAAAASRRSFVLNEILEDCSTESAEWVRQVVDELTIQGWLVCGRQGDQTVFRWNVKRGEFDAETWLSRRLVGTQIKSTPAEDRPRERLLRMGAAQLRTAELLAILIRSGRSGESALQGGEILANQFANNLDRLPDAGPQELSRISRTIGETAFCQIMAGVELGRRVAEASTSTNAQTKISSAQQAVEFCERHFARLISDGNREEFHIVTLNTKNHVIATHQISVGTLDSSLVHPREVFRPAIKDAAASIILVHNHPSGDPTPSPEDLRVTSRLDEAGRNLGINVLDHIVLGSFRSISIRELA